MDIGYQTHVYVGADTEATSATVKLAAVTSVTAPGLTVGEKESTNMDQTDHVRRFIPDLVDPGSAKIGLQWNPADATDSLLRAMITGREIRYWEIQFNGLSPAIWFGGKGFITDYTPGDATPDGELTATITVRPSDGVWAETD